MFIKRDKKMVKEDDRGIALILVIMGLSIMFLIGLAVASTATVEVSLSESSAQDVNAHYLAESGLNQVVAMIRNIQAGDLNDLLAGPDAQCTPSVSNGNCANFWTTTSVVHPLSSHGNELVIDNSSTGTGSATQWASVATGQLLGHSLQPAPLFAPGVLGFQATDTSSIATGGDGSPATFIPCPSGSWVNCPGSGLFPALQWAGRLRYDDPATQTRYVTLVEIYDDDDPLSLEYDAWTDGAVTYPAGFSNSANNSKVYGTNITTTPSCILGGNAANECPGATAGKSLSSINQDFNNKLAVRCTGRILKQYSGQWHVMSESVVDAIVGFLPYPAVIVGKCINMFGSAQITGAYGSLFSNGNICVSGNPSVSQFAGAAGSICGASSSFAPSQAVGQPQLFIPDFVPIPGTTTSPYNDGPQAAPFANPALTLSGPDPGFGAGVQYSVATDGSGRRVYAGDYWLRQIAALTPSSAVGTAPLNPIADTASGGYILLQARGKSGSQRKCLDRTSGCSGSEDGILARLGIAEADLDALQAHVALAPSGTLTGGGNGDSGFDPSHPLIIRLVLRKGVPFSNGSLDVIARGHIFVASLNSSTGTPDTVASSPPSTGPAKVGSNTTYEFYRIVPGGGAGLGETLSWFNGGRPALANPNQSLHAAPGDTNHGWSVDGGTSGSCSSNTDNACPSCGSCAYSGTTCNNPYGGTWTVSNPTGLNDFSLRGYSYFLDGNFTETGTGGKPSIRATLILTGHVYIRGNNDFDPIMKANLAPLQPPFTNPSFQFLAGADIDFGGDVADAVNFSGLAYAREQIRGSGSGTYNGQMVAADKASLDNLVTSNSMGGNYTVSFNQTANVLGTLSITSWRKMKF